MGIKISRNKERNISLSVLSRLVKLPVFPSSERRLKFYLDLAWIFNRLSHEQIFATSLKIEEKVENLFLRSKIQKNAKILDIGCGNGTVMSGILDITHNITGIDYNSLLIEKAKKSMEMPGVSLLCIDVFDFLEANPEEKFDVILLSHLLEHISEPELFLKKLVSKSNLIYIEVPDFETTHLNLYRKAIGTNLNYSDADHVSEFDRSELRGLINNCGLIVIAEEFRFGLIKYWCKIKS